MNLCLVTTVEVELTEEGSRVPVEQMYVKWDTVVIVIDDRVSYMNHEKDVFYTRNVESLIVKMRDAKRFCSQIVLAQFYKKKKHILMLDHHRANSNEAKVGCS